MDLQELRRRFVPTLIVKLGVATQRFESKIASRSLPKFANACTDVVISLPRTIINPENIHMGDHVRFGCSSMLVAMKEYPVPWMDHPDKTIDKQYFSGKIVIGHRVTATSALQITAFSRVIIADDVMFASNVNITDGFHGYDTALIPYKYQPITRVAPIKINSGCWIGQNTVILPGVTIGEGTIIGANSVVAKDIPPRSIALGSPAQVIKLWNSRTRKWIKPNPDYRAVQAPSAHSNR